MGNTRRGGLAVSIHAPREGCDHVALNIMLYREGFNSRTPGGVRHSPKSIGEAYQKFQFTHPGRGATSKTQSSARL